MKILNDEQLAYLKSLESPKKRRKFMLDCLVENALGESEFLKQVEDAINSPFSRAMHQTSTAPETLKAIDYGDFINDEKLIHNWHEKQLDEYNKKQREAQEVFYDKMKSIISENNQSAKEEMFNEEEFLKQTNSFKIVDCDGNTFYRKKFEYLDEKSTKSNYSSEEIEIAKSLNSEREEKKEIVKDEKFRRTVGAIKYIKGYLPYFCFESKTASLKVINSAFDYFKDTYFVVEFDIQEGKEKMIQLNCENVPKEAFDEIEKKWTDNDMICAFEKGNHATCNAFTLREKPSKEQLNLYIELKDEFIKSLKND